MVFLCVNKDCHEEPQPPGPSFECVACRVPLLDVLDDPSTYQLPAPVSNLPPYGSLESSINTTAAYSGSTMGISTSSLYTQAGHPYSSSNCGSVVPRQFSCPTNSHKHDDLLGRGPGSANFRNHEPARLRTKPPGFASTLNSSASSLEKAASLANLKIEYFDPSAAKNDKVKARSCISCYRRNMTCTMAEGQELCEFCSGKSQYCKGTIKMATGFSPQFWIPQVIGRIGAEHVSLLSIVEDNPFFHVRIMLVAENQMSSPFAQPRILENFRLDLRSLRDDTHHSNDRPAWERLFDVICPGPEIPAGHVNDRNANILTSFQRLCRHLRAALALLGSPELCTFDVVTDRYSAGPYIMLETIRQLSALASSTISKIYDLMNEYLAAPRKRSAFRREMLKLASGLGLCHHALSHFGKASIGRNYFPSGLAGLYDVTPCLLEQLQFLGDTFNSRGFHNSSQAIFLKKFGLHIALDPVEGCGVRRVTFIEGFEQFLCPTFSCSTGDTSSAFTSNLPAVLNFPVRENPGGQRSTPDGELQVRPGQPSTDVIERQVYAGQPIDFVEPETADRRVRSKVSLLQQKRDELQKQTTAQIANYNEKIAKLQLLLDPCFVENFGKENFVLFTAQILSDVDDNSLVKHEADGRQEEPVGLNSSNEANSLDSPCRLDRECMPIVNIAMPSSTPPITGQAEKYRTNEQDSPPHKKRKRALGIRKSQQQAIGRSRDDGDAIMPDAMDVLPAPSIAEPTSASVSPFRKQLFQAIPAGLSFLAWKSQTHYKAAGHVDFAPETPLANGKSQRPLSWPRTQQWRKSFGISVKTLRENFEKLSIGMHGPDSASFTQGGLFT